MKNYTYLAIAVWGSSLICLVVPYLIHKYKKC